MDIYNFERVLYKMYVPDCCVRNWLRDIEKKTPDVFTSYTITKNSNYTKNDARYLDELHNLFLCGAHSKEMLLQIAEVSRHVHKKRAIMEVSATIALIAAIGVVVGCCSGR